MLPPASIGNPFDTTPPLLDKPLVLTHMTLPETHQLTLRTDVHVKVSDLVCALCSLFIVLMAIGQAGLLVLVFFAGGILLGESDAGDNDGDKPTVYEYFTEGGITEGLKTTTNYFTLNGKEISLHSGSIHYFRVHPQYWRDRLRKLRAAGFIAVQTYVPWNLHEPYEGVFDFGDGGEEMSPFLDIRTFLRIAYEEDLLAIVRPGPYICAEWEFGGMPSWLLKYSGIKVRTNDTVYMNPVTRYFTRLLPILKSFQFSTGDGPIIAFQVENEYGNTKGDNTTPDKAYLSHLKQLYEDHGLVELFFTSDTPSKGGEYGTLDGVLQTANFNSNATQELNLLKGFQPDKAAMVAEFWTGWFDHWGEAHHNMTLEDFKSVLEDILKYPSGVNFYMFHGGTSFGFLNGANVYDTYPYSLPDISSYDYDAPLTEAGDYTPKYNLTKEIFAQYQKVALKTPSLPAETEKVAYETVAVKRFLDWNSLLAQVNADDVQHSCPATYMELLPINGGSGQSFGYIVYRINNQSLNSNSNLTITEKIKGVAMVVVNNTRRSKALETIADFRGFGYWCSNQTSNSLSIATQEHSNNTVDIIIENWSRNNFGTLSQFNENRGLTDGQIAIDGQPISTFDIYPLQFKGNWVQSLSQWEEAETETPDGPVLLNFLLTITDPVPKDTFLDMSDWGKGIVFVNGFNIGRYATVGPLRSLFIPAPLMKTGVNEINVFEHFQPATELKFSKTIIFKNAVDTFDTSLL